MKDYFKTKTWLITTSIFIIALGLSSAFVYYEFGFNKNIRISRASVNDNVFGLAWDSNIGWISFNSIDCDKNGNGFVDTNVITSGCNGNDNETTPVRDYGVKIDLTTGNFSGYAWSSNVGWISFSETVEPPDSHAFNVKCPSCTLGNNCTACYNLTDKNVYGWAKILSLGVNGWIKFNGNKQDGQPWTSGVTINPATGNFSGWAWNANDNSAGGDSGSGIGWISFNCDHTTDGTLPPDNINTCGASNYKVVGNINRPPTVANTNMTAPNWSFTNASDYGALYAKLGWIFSDQDTGSSEYAYQIKVNTQNDINNPIFDTGKCLGVGSCEPTGCDPTNCKFANGGSGTTYFTLNNISGLKYNNISGLEYNKAYYWWVQVWDNYNAASATTTYNTAQDIPYPEANDGNWSTFTTYKHEMPIANFTWFPLEPSKGEEVKLISQSKRFNSSNPSGPSLDCTDNDVLAGSRCTYNWYNGVLPVGVSLKSGYSLTASTTVVIFNNAGANTVVLTVTDNGDTGAIPYYNIISKTVNVNAELPSWKEVKPE